MVPRAIGADSAGLYRARVTATTPHMFYGELVGADNQPLPLLPNLAPEAAALSSPLAMV